MELAVRLESAWWVATRRMRELWEIERLLVQVRKLREEINNENQRQNENKHNRTVGAGAGAGNGSDVGCGGDGGNAAMEIPITWA